MEGHLPPEVKNKYLVLRTQYVHLMHQSIKVDQRKPTAQMILLWAVRANQGAAKKRKFWINIWQLTLCSSSKLSSIIFPSILPTENIFTVPFHRGYEIKKMTKAASTLLGIKMISLSSYRDSSGAQQRSNASLLWCTASICHISAALKILKNLKFDYVVFFLGGCFIFLH